LSENYKEKKDLIVTNLYNYQLERKKNLNKRE
jgi:hypothetical protein